MKNLTQFGVKQEEDSGWNHKGIIGKLYQKVRGIFLDSPLFSDS